MNNGTINGMYGHTEVQRALLLDVVVGERPSVFKLLSGEDQTLLVWGNTFLVLNLRLDIVDGVGRLHLKGDGLSRQRLDKDLHTTAQTKN